MSFRLLLCTLGTTIAELQQTTVMSLGFYFSKTTIMIFGFSAPYESIILSEAYFRGKRGI